MNIRFHYLYRDGGNYKKFHSEVFSNSRGLAASEVNALIRARLIDGEWFYAYKWGLPELVECFENSDPTWHEYDCIEPTLDQPTKGNISEFLTQISKV